MSLKNRLNVNAASFQPKVTALSDEELNNLKAQYKKQFIEYQGTKLLDQQGYHCEVMKPLWGELLIGPELVESIVAMYNEAIKTRPKVKLYDIGAGSGMLLVMLHLAGIPKDALVGVELPKEHLWLPQKRYWKMIESDCFTVPATGILLMSFTAPGKPLYHKPISNQATILTKYVNSGGKEVILIGNNKSLIEHPRPNHFAKFNDWKVDEKPMSWYGAGPYASGMAYSINIRK